LSRALGARQFSSVNDDSRQNDPGRRKNRRRDGALPDLTQAGWNQQAGEGQRALEKTQLSAADVEGFLQQEDKVLYSPTPSRMMVHAEFMHKIGSLKNMPESWKDLFFENVHDRPGS
jgi:hypothetical protein